MSQIRTSAAAAARPVTPPRRATMADAAAAAAHLNRLVGGPDIGMVRPRTDLEILKASFNSFEAVSSEGLPSVVGRVSNRSFASEAKLRRIVAAELRKLQLPPLAVLLADVGAPLPG